jgi:hypothetical protein
MQYVPGGKVNILGGHIIVHSMQKKSVYVPRLHHIRLHLTLNAWSPASTLHPLLRGA